MEFQYFFVPLVTRELIRAIEDYRKKMHELREELQRARLQTSEEYKNGKAE